jgi:sugar lactone lactonase YvrE
MNRGISVSRCVAAAIACLVLMCGTASRAWSANLWVAYWSSETIDSYKPKQLAHSGMPTPIELSPGLNATGVAFDKHHNLWAVLDGDEVAEFSAKQVKKLKQNPSPTPVAVITSTSNFSSFIVGCNFDRDGNLWIVDADNDSIYELSKSQLAAGSGDVTPAIVISSADLDFPNFITFDKWGNAWIDNEDGNSIAQFSASQLASSGSKSAAILISDDGSGSLSAPGEIGFDRKGNLWVPNYGNNTVVEFTRSQLAGSGSPTPAVTLGSTIFVGPWGLAFKGNKLVVMNYDDAMIAKFTANQLKSSGAPVPKVAVQGLGSENYQVIFGPSF